MAQFSQFVDPPPPYLHRNRIVDYIELYKILRASDGLHFDAHFANILAANRDPDFGRKRLIRTRLRECHDGFLRLDRRPAERFPHSFALMRQMVRSVGQMVRSVGCHTFVQILMGPSGVQAPKGERYGITLPTTDWSELHDTFASRHCVQFKDFIASPLLGELTEQIALAKFGAMYHDPLGIDYSMDFGPTQAMLHYLITDERLLATVERIANIPPCTLDRFTGRVYRMIKNRDRDGYHDDVHLLDRRLVAISVSMTREPCQGGALHLRRKRWLRPFHLSTQAELGEAVLFRISRHLQHKVGNVLAGSRTNLAGWYCARAGFDYEAWVDAPCFSDEGRSALRTMHRRLFARR